MGKYIDADRLRAEIERRKVQHQQDYESGDTTEFHRIVEDDAIVGVIDSLQQDPRFPQYDNIVDKVFGAGNLESLEYEEAEMLVALAKEELLNSLQQEQPKLSSNLIDADAVRDDFVAEVYRVLDTEPTNDRANAIIDAFDSLPTIPQEQPEVDLEEITKFSRIKDLPDGFDKDWLKYYHTDKEYNSVKFHHFSTLEREYSIASHFYDLGCRRTAEKADEIEYNRQRAEEQGSEGLEEEISKKYANDTTTMRTREQYAELARHFAQWGAEHLADARKTSPNDLKEAAARFSKNVSDGHNYRYLRVGFIAGAKWDREQMMKEAVECELVCLKDRLLAVLPIKEFQWTVGDKVKLIIVKED